MEELSAFASSVKDGLSSKKKTLSSRYFYDDRGSQLFKEIMGLEEYYLTKAEYEILDEQASAIYQALQYQEPFNIVELGAGDGKKTIRFLEYLSKSKVDFTYIPIDISQEANDMLLANIKTELPWVDVAPRTGDYFDMLDDLNQDKRPSLILFLGSNIGNYSIVEAKELMQAVSSRMDAGDTFLVGVDLQKNPLTIASAYNDRKGVTRAFNLNLLERINRELGGDFDMDYWDFYSFYNPHNGEVNSFLISLKAQDVHVSAIEETFSFGENELIYTELSRKYNEDELRDLAHSCGIKVVQFFKDKKGYFTDVLLSK